VTTTAHTVVAADTSSFYQGIEGCNFNDANWGAAGAQPIVVEFWVYSTLTGTFAGCLQNGAATRSYVFTYSIPTANVWTKIRLNILGDTAGTWAVAQNAVAAWLVFNLGTGSTRTTAAGAWTAGNFTTAPGAVNPVAILNATFYVTGAALMVGAAAANAEPEFKKYSDNLIDCSRYFTRINIQGAFYQVAAGGVNVAGYFPTIMRASPTLAVTTNNSTNFTASPTLSSFNVFNGCLASGAMSVSGTGNMNIIISADADF
jgi:hypothetical protein